MKAMIRMTLYPLTAAALLAALTLTAAQPASADVIDLPAGTACQDFGLRLERTNGNLHTTEFKDKNGNLVRILTAGKGFLLKYTNLNSGKYVTIRTDGSVSSTRINSDGTQTVTATGHNGLILFPTDVPAGPTTTQYIERIVYTVDATGVFTLLSTSGSASNIFAKPAG
jgi:autotransporter passenger strand-loop-strand repeat protein